MTAVEWVYVAVALTPILVVGGLFVKEIIRHVRGDCDGC